MKYEDKTEKQLLNELIELRQKNVELNEALNECRQCNKILKESEERLRALIENTSDWIWEVDKVGRVTYSNPKVKDLLGYEPEEILGKTSFDHMPAEEIQRVREIFEKAVREKKSFLSLEKTKLRKDGRRVVLEASAVPIFDSKENLLGYRGIDRDITVRKEMEEKQKKYTSALRDRVKELNCLFKISNIIEKQLTPFEEKIQKIVDLIPPAYQYPEITCAQVSLNGQTFNTKKFKETIWKQESDIIVRYHQIGTLKVCYLEEKPECDEGPFQKEERNLTNVIAERIAGIFERKLARGKLNSYQQKLRSLASELSLTEERERRRIATELHDGVGQMLFLTKLKVEELQQKMSSLGLIDSLNEIHGLIEQVIKDTRSLTFELSPPTLYLLGFEKAVEWLTEQIQEQHSIKCHIVNDEHPKPLKDDIRVLLFQAVRELLINTAKHAQAKKVNVSIVRYNNTIKVSIEDDGVGFVLSKNGFSWDKTNGFGLFSIKERLDHLGGKLEIESEPGKGTRATLLAPLFLKKN